MAADTNTAQKAALIKDILANKIIALMMRIFHQREIRDQES